MELNIKVIPRAAKTEMAGEMADGTLKVRVKAVPEEGKANDELCHFLARHYGVARHDGAGADPRRTGRLLGFRAASRDPRYDAHAKARP